MRRGARGERRGNYFYIKRWFLTDKAHREVRAHVHIKVNNLLTLITTYSYRQGSKGSACTPVHIYQFSICRFIYHVNDPVRWWLVTHL